VVEPLIPKEAEKQSDAETLLEKKENRSFTWKNLARTTREKGKDVGVLKGGEVRDCSRFKGRATGSFLSGARGAHLKKKKSQKPLGVHPSAPSGKKEM